MKIKIIQTTTDSIKIAELISELLVKNNISEIDSAILIESIVV